MRDVERLRCLPGLVHGMITRENRAWGAGASEGPFAAWNLGLSTDDHRDRIVSNRQRVAEALGFERLVMPHQVHGTAIRELLPTTDHPGKCDGLLVREPGLLAGVMGADCPGFLLVHPPSHTLIVAHAGWRGIAGSMATRAVERLAAETGGHASSFVAAIGPGIGQDRYEVSPDVVEALQCSLPFDLTSKDLARASKRLGHAYVDLCGILRAQFVVAGVSEDTLFSDGTCTFDRHDLWFSHRRDQGVTGRHALVAGWRV